MHRIKAILFDIDDTLYDLSIPFKEAFREFFPGEEIDLDGAFLASRKYSDRIYDRSLSGEISMEEMYIYRLGNAFRDYGKIIAGATALQFQSVYENPVAKKEEDKAIKMLSELYEYYTDHPEAMSREYRELVEYRGVPKEQAVCDYISGMTDQYSMEKFREIYIPKSWEVY